MEEYIRQCSEAKAPPRSLITNVWVLGRFFKQNDCAYLDCQHAVHQLDKAVLRARKSASGITV